MIYYWKRLGISASHVINYVFLSFQHPISSSIFHYSTHKRLEFCTCYAMCILNLERTLSVLWNELSEKSHYTDRINFDYHPVPPFIRKMKTIKHCLIRRWIFIVFILRCNLISVFTKCQLYFQLKCNFSSDHVFLYLTQSLWKTIAILLTAKFHLNIF